MKATTTLIFAAAIIASSSAVAQGLSRADVQAQLVDAQRNGLQYVTDTSYPEVHPMFKARVQKMRADVRASAGGVAEGSGASGHVDTSPRSPANNVQHDTCVGPAPFCNVYFGS